MCGHGTYLGSTSSFVDGVDHLERTLHPTNVNAGLDLPTVDKRFGPNIIIMILQTAPCSLSPVDEDDDLTQWNHR